MWFHVAYAEFKHVLNILWEWIHINWDNLFANSCLSYPKGSSNANELIRMIRNIQLEWVVWGIHTWLCMNEGMNGFSFREMYFNSFLL